MFKFINQDEFVICICGNKTNKQLIWISEDSDTPKTKPLSLCKSCEDKLHNIHLENLTATKN